MGRTRVCATTATTFVALAIIGAVAQPARAQRGIDAHLARPAMDGYGIFTVERAETARQWDFGFKIFTNYAGNPLRLDMYDELAMPMPGPRTQVVMDRQVAIHLGLHLGLTDWLQLALDFPVSAQNYTPAYGKHGSFADNPLVRTGFFEGAPYTNIPPPDGSALDARLGLKARLFRKGIVGMAIAAVMTIPFGDDGHFLGDTNFTFRPNVILDITRGAFTLGINVGAIVRETTTVVDPRDVALKVERPRILLSVGHELTWGVGAAYRFVRWVGVAAEMIGFAPLATSGGNRDVTGDVLAGFQFFPRRDLILSVGGGAGYNPNAARRDEYQAFLGIAWAPADPKKSTIAGGGADSDNDGIPDGQDLCPNEPEDKDGFDDEDGCPDLDNDQDGVPDKRDRCPNDAEDRDGFEDEDGCPENDNDKDGIPDAQDRCPNDAEDRDGFQDEDGCPDLDNDGDGIPDEKDKCPNEPETRNGVDDDDGCPDSGGAAVPSSRVELAEVIPFESGRERPTSRGEQLLEAVATKLKANPQVRRVRIEGHTDDSERPPKKRQELAQARALAVREILMKRGVDGDRLQAVGYGDARPIDKRSNAEARAKNRRVEFIIVEQ
jgi:flagellar motor protein MotB